MTEPLLSALIKCRLFFLAYVSIRFFKIVTQILLKYLHYVSFSDKTSMQIFKKTFKINVSNLVPLSTLKKGELVHGTSDSCNQKEPRVTVEREV